jgi:hypothetical protein
MDTRPLKIYNKLQADAMAKAYINDDKYLMMAPERMLHIAKSLLMRCSSTYHADLYKIIEVLRHKDNVMTFASKMNTP